VDKKHLDAAEAQFKGKAGAVPTKSFHEIEQTAQREKTARLRALRLAKEAEDGLNKPRGKRCRAARICVVPATPSPRK
jgi:hypothetical protein